MTHDYLAYTITSWLHSNMAYGMVTPIKPCENWTAVVRVRVCVASHSSPLS